IVKLFASGCGGDSLALAIRFTRSSVFGLYFTGVIHIFSGFLQLKGNFIVPASIGIPFSLITIAVIFISYKTNILVLAIGSVIATASQLLLLIPFIYKKSYRYKLVLDVKDEYIKRMLYIALPIIIGVSVNEINIL